VSSASGSGKRDKIRFVPIQAMMQRLIEQSRRSPAIVMMLSVPSSRSAHEPWVEDSRQA